jgi:1-acyl-sn-glycerol-3-phosphate acyltransferase
VLSTAATVLYVIPGTLALSSLAFLVAWLPPRGDWTSLVARVWARGILAAAGVRVVVEVDPAVDPHRGYVVMANHQSYFDVVALLAVTPGSYRFVAKRSLFAIPIFGWALWAGGFVPVDREDRSRAREIWAAAGDRLRRGASVVFYPEGTRSADGRVHRFQRGAFLVALKTQAPILPAGISGARSVLPRGTLRVAPGTITVRFGAPVETRDVRVRDKAALTARVRTEVARLADAELAPDPPPA